MQFSKSDLSRAREIPQAKIKGEASSAALRMQHTETPAFAGRNRQVQAGWWQRMCTSLQVGNSCRNFASERGGVVPASSVVSTRSPSLPDKAHESVQSVHFNTDLVQRNMEIHHRLKSVRKASRCVLCRGELRLPVPRGDSNLLPRGRSCIGHPIPRSMACRTARIDPVTLVHFITDSASGS